MPGTIVAIAACILAALLSVPAASHTGLTTWFSIACASTAFTAMGLNQFLAARPRFLEPLFGGLDRMYQLHKRLGIAALVLILAHYFVTPNFQGKVLTTGLNDVAKEAGEIGFYGLVALIAFSLIKRLPKTRLIVPYHWWRQSHRFIGIFFIFIVFHFNFIKRPFDGTALLATYLNIFAVLGIAGFFWTQIRPALLRRAYTVTGVDRRPSATIITAKPVGRGIRTRPGQFAFINADKPGLREPHPFTIAGQGTDADDSLRFAIKPLGDFTRRLRESISIGDRLMVEGGHGRFNFERGGDRQLWVAGGIGITPFLAMADRLAEMPDKRAHLIHCVRDESEAIDAERLAALAQTADNFDFTLHVSSRDGRLDAAALADRAKVALKGADLWFCGPGGLRVALEKGLTGAGNTPGRIEFERFEFR